VSLQQVEALGNNQRACRDTAQQIRRAGVKMPEALIALAALDPKFFDAIYTASQPPGEPAGQPPSQPLEQPPSPPAEQPPAQPR